MAFIAVHLNAEVIPVVTVSIAIGMCILPSSPTSIPPFPVSPSLISRIVSVDVKHHVYLLASQYQNRCHDYNRERRRTVVGWWWGRVGDKGGGEGGGGGGGEEVGHFIGRTLNWNNQTAALNADVSYSSTTEHREERRQIVSTRWPSRSTSPGAGCGTWWPEHSSVARGGLVSYKLCLPLACFATSVTRDNPFLWTDGSSAQLGFPIIARLFVCSFG